MDPKLTFCASCDHSVEQHFQGVAWQECSCCNAGEPNAVYDPIIDYYKKPEAKPTRQVDESLAEPKSRTPLESGSSPQAPSKFADPFDLDWWDGNGYGENYQD